MGAFSLSPLLDGLLFRLVKITPPPGILGVPPHLIEGSVQKRWNDAVGAATAEAEKMTPQEIFAMVERNSGWVTPEEARKAMRLPIR